MTSVNVTTTKNTVTVNGETRVVTVKTQGPQGPAFSDGDIGDIVISGGGTVATIDNGAVNNAKIASDAAIDLTKLATGALPTAITVTSANISDLSIVDADISGSAAISLSKLATGALPTAITVTSANISDLSIVNADINASAAIAGTKISPDFGSQNIVTTGTGATGALGVTGDITVSGTVDGRDVAADGTKLDGIETGATADQTASEIKTAYESNSDTNAFTDTLLSKLNGIESNATADQTKSDIDALGIAASTAATLANARTIAGTSFDGSANIDISYTNLTNKLSVGDGGLTQNNFTDALKTKLDGVETGATADQTASEIVALIADQTIAPSTIDMEDNEKIKLGTGDDLEIYHDGSNSIIKNTTNDLTLQTTGDDLLLKASDNIALYVQGTENAINCIGNGAVDLFFNNSKKFATTSTGVTVTGNIAVTGTVDGRDVASDGTKLDGIETAATADQTAAEIKTLLDSNGIVNSNVDASAAIAGTKISPNFGSQNVVTTGTFGSGDITILDASPSLRFTENDANPDYKLIVNNGVFKIVDETNSNAERFVVNTDGHIDVTGNLDIGAGVDVTGNITVTGTVDGVDIATRDTLFGGLTSSSGVLTNGVTATTQSASDNSTKVATTAYTDTAIANLVDSAPGTLNTLNELAAALGDDANFSTTVTNSIATKLPLAGGTLTGNLKIVSDTLKLFLGASEEMQVFHDGTSSLIKDTRDSGKVRIQADNFDFIDKDASGVILSATSSGLSVTGNITVTGTVDGRDIATDGTKLDGIESNATADQTASEIVSLLSDQDITTTGNFGAASVNITDNSPSLIFTDSANDSDFRIRVQSGVLKLRDDTNSANRLEINSSGIVTIPGNTDFGAGIDVTGNITVTGTVDGRDLATDGTKLDGIASNAIANIVEDTTPQLGGDLDTNSFEILLDDDHKIKFGSSNEFEIYHDSSSAYGIIRNVGQGTIIRSAIFNVKNAGGTKDMIIANTNGDVELYYDNSKKFETKSNGINVTGRLLATGSSGYGLIFNDDVKISLGNSNDLQIYHDGSNSYIEDAGTGSLILKTNHFVANAGAYSFMNAANSETLIYAVENGSVQLYHDNSKKFETWTSGARLPSDNNVLAIGAGDDLRFWHNATNSIIRNATGELQIQSNSLRLANYNATETYITATENGAVNLFYDDSKKFETTSTGVSVTGNIAVSGTVDGVDVAALSASVSGFLSNVVEDTSPQLGGELQTNGNDISFADNDRATFGAGDDFRIFHNGSDNFISGTGNIYLKSSGFLDIRSDGNETMIKATPNGAVELYHDGSLKANTRSDGFEIKQHLTMGDSDEIRLGNSSDLKIYHDGSNSYIQDVGTGQLRFLSNDYVFYNAGGNENIARFIENGAVELYFNGSKKAFTYADGLHIDTGVLRGDDNALIKLGNDGDLQIYHDSSTNDGFIKELGTGRLQIWTSSLHLKNQAGDEINLVTNENGNCELWFDNSKKFETTSTGATVTGTLAATNTNITTQMFMPDNGQIRLGDSDDLQIYHDGSNSYIQNSTGGLFIKNTDGSNLDVFSHGSARIRVNAGEMAVDCSHNSSVDLYFDNSKKLGTASDGITVYGRIAADELDMGDSEKIKLGTGDDLQIYHDGSNSYIKNSTGMMRIQGTQFQVKDEDGNESLATFIPQGAVELYYDNSKKFETTSVGINVTGSITADDLRTDNSQTFFLTTASDFRFRNTGGTERMRIDTSGDVAIGTTTTTHKFTVVNDAIQQVGQFLAGSTSYDETVLQAACSRNVTNGSYNHFKCSINGVADKMRVRDSGNVQNTNNSYGSLSDERLKENIVDATSQWNDIKNIRVRKFNFKEGVDPAKPTLLGVIAQEAELVCPNLIETDVQLQAGEEKEYKSFKYSVLYMKAIKCLQEAMAKIEVLETKVATLEGA